MSTAVEIVGMALGAIVVLAFCWVWVKKQEVSFPALGGLLIGAFLVTASIWAHVQIQVSKDGVSANFDRLQKEIAGVQVAHQDLAGKTLQLTDATQENAKVLRDLSQSVSVLNPAAFDATATRRRLDGQLLRVENLKADLLRTARRPVPPPN